MHSIQLTFCELRIHEGWCESVFLDGKTYGALAHDTAEYRALAEWLGYEDITAYMVDHEFCHHFVSEHLQAVPSPSKVLWPLAHGYVGESDAILREEALSICFQAFLNGRVSAMAATAPKVDMYRLKLKALEMLGRA
jgi:hypothetical protein